jgi:malate dehydrogenase
VPVILGSRGVERVVEIDLNEEERAEFRKSVAAVHSLIKDVERLL